MTDLTPAELMDDDRALFGEEFLEEPTMMTQGEIEALLNGTTPGPWQADGEPWSRIVWSSAENRVCFMAHSNGLDDARDIATSNLAAAAPDLARTALALHQQLADALAASPEVAALIDKELAALQDPLVVHLNMVAGKIAKPLPSQLVHIYGEDAIRTAFTALILDAEARGMERACLAVSERAEWPEDEHGRTEQPALFARVINAIRAEAAALRGEKEPK